MYRLFNQIPSYATKPAHSIYEDEETLRPPSIGSEYRRVVCNHQRLIVQTTLTKAVFHP